MSITAVLGDWRTDYLPGGGAQSLLLLPLGTGTVLEHVQAQVSAADAHHIAVLPNFAWDAEYVDAVQRTAPRVQIVAPTAWRSFLDAHELADWLLLVDGRHIPASGFEFRVLLRGAARSRVIRHLVQMERSSGGTRERVVCDEQARVRGIQRLYDGVTHLGTAGVSASLITVALARHLGQPELFCLETLRAQLATRGVPAQDLTASGTNLDLTRARDVLALSERFAIEAVAQGEAAGYEVDPSGAWLGRGARLGAGVRVHGPVILQAGAHVQAGATIIGPTVVGPGATIGPRAVIAQCLVGAAARVPAEACLAHQVVAPGRELVPSNGVLMDRPAPALLVLPEHEAGNVTAPVEAGSARRDGYGIAKRGLDLAAALCGLVFLAPLLVSVGALVRLTSPGPMLFGHEREGRGGRPFRCWKFRTMVAQAHQQQRALYRQNGVDGPQFKLANDPRITWLGQWLRTTNIDELPQLWNVLCGQMSLIGPRPSPFRENQICVPWRNARLSVRPGITGLWQVCRAERAAGDFHQWIYFDMLYVRHLSLSLDLRILLATLVTLGGRWSVPVRWMIRPQRDARARAGAARGVDPPSRDSLSEVALPSA